MGLTLWPQIKRGSRGLIGFLKSAFGVDLDCEAAGMFVSKSYRRFITLYRPVVATRCIHVAWVFSRKTKQDCRKTRKHDGKRESGLGH